MNHTLKQLTDLGLLKETPPKPEVLFYPDALDWMWDYCVYLGSCNVDGHQFDMGIYHNSQGFSMAVVTENTPGSYISGWPCSKNYLFKEEFDRLVQKYIKV